MSKRVKKPFNAAAEANRLRHEYPCNLFLKIFPEFDGAKFATVYVDNIKIILDIYKDNNIGFKALELFYDKHLTIGAICEILGVKRAGDYAEEAINIIKDNKDVIFNGFRYSKLRKSVISNLHKTGFSKITAAALADCGLYSLSDIKNLKDGKTLINKLSKEFEPEVVGKVLQNILKTLNDLGVDTTKFGYVGHGVKISEPKKDSVFVLSENVNRITNYEFNGLSETSFKVQCPKCDRHFRIRVTGYVDNEGKLRLDSNINNESGIFYCQHCNAPVNVDKVDRFIRNYL